MQLMRNDLKKIFPNINDAHAGLLMQRGLTEWEEGEKPIKSKLIDTISKVDPSELYLLAFERWLNNTFEDANEGFATLAATVEGRLYTGLPLGGTLETGASIHHTYGMPIIAGSAVKGAVRSYTEHLFAKRDTNGQIQYDADNNIVIQPDKKNVLDILFGADSDDVDEADAGYLIWHDAWWIPMVNDHGELLTGDKYKPFAKEIVTVHHQAYYKRDIDKALDMESPVPNQQVAIQGSFYFAIEGESKWVKFAKELLQRTIEDIGLGAKTSSGYGYFKQDNEVNNDIAKRYGKGAVIDDSSDPLAAIRQIIKYKDETQLIQGLSSGKTAFFKELGINRDDESDIKKIVQVVMEEHADKVSNWENENAKNTIKAYKFIKKYE